MSNVATIKQAIRDWLELKMRIDVWDLDVPMKLFADTSTQALPLPAMSAISYPVKDLMYQRGEGGAAGNERVTGFAGLTFSLVYRFTGQLTAEQLPIDDVEAIAEFLYVSSMFELQGCNGLRRLVPEPSEFPVQLTRMEDSQSDWLVYLHMLFNVEFHVTSIGLAPEYSNPGSGSGEEISKLRELNIKVFRGDLDGITTDNTLDSDTIISRVQNNA